MITDDLQALILADAIGALDDAEQEQLQAALATLPYPDQKEAGKLYDVALLVTATAEEQEPSPDVRGRVLAAIAVPGTYTITNHSAWQYSGVPGIEAKVLAVDRDRGLVTMLLRGETGAIYPSHHHSTPEECYVVRGSISVGDLVLRPGDFHHADADSDHSEIHVLEPSEVLLVAGIDDYMPH